MLKVHHLPGVCGGRHGGYHGLPVCVVPTTAGDAPMGEGVRPGAAERACQFVSVVEPGGEGCAGMDERGPWEPLDQGGHENGRTRERAGEDMYLEALVLFGGGIQDDIAPLG